VGGGGGGILANVIGGKNKGKRKRGKCQRKRKKGEEKGRQGKGKEKWEVKWLKKCIIGKN
jgi:hypothetical protein